MKRKVNCDNSPSVKLLIKSITIVCESLPIKSVLWMHPFIRWKLF